MTLESIVLLVALSLVCGVVGLIASLFWIDRYLQRWRIPRDATPPTQPNGEPDAGSMSRGVVWIGVAASVVGIVMWLTSAWSAHWPVVDGTVESARVREHHRKFGWTYEAEIHYRYVFDGVAHRSSNWRCGDDDDLLRESAAARIVAAHPPGSPLRVHVCPHWSRWSVVQAGSNARLFFYVGLGLLLVTGTGLFNVFRSALGKMRDQLSAGVGERRRDLGLAKN